MVEEELEEQAAVQAGITVSGKDVDEALLRVALQNNLTVNTILSEAKRSGLSEAQYRDELRRQLLQSRLTSTRLQSRVQVTESDLRAAYRKFVQDERREQPTRSLRLVLPAGTTPAEQAQSLAMAEELRARVARGEPFSDLVRTVPGLPGTGLSPATPPAQEPEALARALTALAPGELSRPLPLAGTLVLLQVVERPPSSLPTFEEAQDELQQRVYMEKMAKARAHWISGLRRRTHVEVRL